MAVLGGVAVSKLLRMLPFAGQENPLPRYQHPIEQTNAGRLAVLGAELGGGLTGPTGGTGDDGQPGRIHRHGAAHREIPIRFGHGPTWHHQQFVNVRRAGDDGLDPRDADSLGVPPDDPKVSILIRLGVRPQRAVALGAVSYTHLDVYKRQVLPCVEDLNDGVNGDQCSCVGDVGNGTCDCWEDLGDGDDSDDCAP